MDTLNNLIEKVLTLNVNANTNIDVQAIIEKYVLYTQASKVIIAILGFLAVVIIAVLVYKAHCRSHRVKELGKTIEATIDKMEEYNNGYNRYDIRDSLKEILEYMPRNKKKRKIE